MEGRAEEDEESILSLVPVHGAPDVAGGCGPRPLPQSNVGNVVLGRL